MRRPQAFDHDGRSVRVDPLHLGVGEHRDGVLLDSRGAPLLDRARGPVERLGALPERMVSRAHHEVQAMWRPRGAWPHM